MIYTTNRRAAARWRSGPGYTRGGGSANMSVREMEVRMGDPVALAGCTGYERETVEERTEQLLELLGGPGAFAGRGRSVFVKVNALFGAAPEKGVTTHPEVARAVVRQFQRVTDRVTVGDSPGGPFTPAYLRRVYERTGIAQVARETGARLGLDVSTRQVRVAEGRALKAVTVCDAMAGADCLVSVAKFKTHMFMNVSGAVKNMFGAVPGSNKLAYHSRFHRDTEFADLIVDVLLASAPDLSVVDAVVGMDGNGPRAGRLVDIGVLAAGRDALAVDTVMMGIVGIDPDKNKPLAAARRRGLCSGDIADIEVLGGRPDELSFNGFVPPDRRSVGERVPGFLVRPFGGMMALRPAPVPGRCTACGRCAETCPAGAIALQGGVAVVDRWRCLHCYCCHELCEHDAIELLRPPLMRILHAGRTPARS